MESATLQENFMEVLLEFMGSTYQVELGEATLDFKVYIIQVEFWEMNQSL